MSDEYNKKFNEYIKEHGSVLDIMKNSEFFQAIIQKAEEDGDEDVSALHNLAAKHAAEVQPILDNFIEVMSDPKKASQMLEKLGHKLSKEG